MRFNPPPNWPPAPAGWQPGPGWQPDPSWPAAPTGWQLWVDDTPPPAAGFQPPAAPPIGSEAATAVHQSPGAGLQPPTSNYAGQQPPTSAYQSPATGQQPPVTGQQPPTSNYAGQQPPTTAYQPTGGGYQPQAGGQPPPTTAYQPSGNDYQSPGGGYPPSPGGYPPSPGGYPAPGGGNFPAGSSGTGASGFSFSAISVPTRWALGGGIALFLGALLPFVSVHLSTNLFSGGFTASSGISGVARFASAIFGLILAGLGAAAQFGPASAGPRRAFKIVLLALSALGVLGYLGFTVIGIVGFSRSAGFDASVHETYSPNVGLILSILGCAACIYAGIAFLRQPSTPPGPLGQVGQY